jgi:putative NADPH-quinone reductase
MYCNICVQKYRYAQEVTDPLAAEYQRRLLAADYLILVFPVWWESMPAGTKGFLDKVLTKGIVYKEPDKVRRFINGMPNIQGISC